MTRSSFTCFAQADIPMINILSKNFGLKVNPNDDRAMARCMAKHSETRFFYKQHFYKQQ